MADLSSSPSFSTRSCDRCHGRKKSCSMHLPECSLCRSCGIPCTYVRPMKRARATPLSKFTLPPTKAFDEFSTLSIRSSLGSDSQDFSKHIQDLLSRSHLLEVLLGLINLPLYEANPKDRKVISSLVNSLKNFKVQPELMITMVRRGSPTIIDDQFYGSPTLRYKALKAYFRYVNPFSPLFTWDSFCRRPRSRFLNLVVFLSGIRLLESPQDSYPWFGRACTELIGLANRNILHPSLDNLQAFMILRLTLYSVPQLKAVARFGIFILERFVFCLGLHSKQLRVDEFDSLERKLTYNTVLFLLDYDAITVRKHICTTGSTHRDLGQLSRAPSLGSSASYMDKETEFRSRVYSDCILMLSNGFSYQISLIRDVIRIRHAIHLQEVPVSRIEDQIWRAHGRCKEYWDLTLHAVDFCRSQLFLNMAEEEAWDKTLAFLNLIFQQIELLLLELCSHTHGRFGTDLPSVAPVGVSKPIAGQLALAGLRLIELGIEFGSAPYLPERIYIFISAHQTLDNLCPESEVVSEAKSRSISHLCGLLRYPFLTNMVLFQMHILNHVSSKAF